MTETDISNEIIRRLGLPYKDKNQYMIHCPEHNDKRPSCSITKSINGTSVGAIHCWSCGFSKSLKTYYYEQTGHSIYRDLGISRDEIPLNPIRQETVSLETTPEAGFKFNGDLVMAYKSRKGYSWLKKRGFDQSDADSFNIKYTKYSKSYNKNNPSEDVTTIINRVIIPIYEKSKLICFEARDVDGEEIYKENLAKKNLSIEDHPYKKVIYPKLGSTNTLYRFDQLDTNKPLFVVEGIMDVISLQKSKVFANSTATFRNLASERQIYLLSKFNEIILIPNNDAPSYIGAKKLFEALGNKIKILKVPKGVKDVNDIIMGRYDRAKTIDDLLSMGWLDKIEKATYSLIDSRIQLLI